jgi:hypothetical protein
MSILAVVLTLIVVGIMLYLVNAYIPMQRTIKTILNALVIICVVIWLLKVFGIWQYLHNVRV